MAAQKEGKIQSEILSYFEADPFVVWCMVTTTGKTKMSSGFWVTLGLPGIPDIIGQLANGKMFGYEVKQPGEKLTDEQSKFINLINSNKGHSSWGSSLTDAIRWLDSIKGAKPAKIPNKRGSRLPEDWELPDEWYQWAIETRPDVDAALEADKFKDYWLSRADKGAIKVDWQRTWRNWIRSAFATRKNNERYRNSNRSSNEQSDWIDQELF